MEVLQHTRHSSDFTNLPQAAKAPLPRTIARRTPGERRNAAFGWFSIGLGVSELLANRHMARMLGVREDDTPLRLLLAAFGVRELISGVGLLSQKHSAAWAWSRAGGDALDLAFLGVIAGIGRAERRRALAAAGAVLGVAGVDVAAAVLASRRRREPLAQGVSVAESITIKRAPEEVYAFFRALDNLPTFMSHVEMVRVQGGRSHWRARGPLGSSIEWDAELVEERPARLLAWRSLPGAEVPNRGRVEFRPAPGDRGTELSVELSYDPPLGAVGRAVAQLFGSEPSQEIKGDLRRLKQVLETGEVLHSDASVHRGMHAARPPKSITSRMSANYARQVKA